MREIIRRTFDSTSIDFIEAGNGLEAVAAYEAHHPSWVIMDIEMPEMDGLTATRAIRHDDPAAQIILMSQHQDSLFPVAALDAGARAFFQKDDLCELPEVIASSANDSIQA